MGTTAESKITVFKIFGDCLTKRSGGTLDRDPGFEAAMSNYMLCRIFRMSDFLMGVAVKLERYQTVLSKADFYHLAYSLAPKRVKPPYSDFIKKRKKDDEEEAAGTSSAEIDDGFAII